MFGKLNNSLSDRQRSGMLLKLVAKTGQWLLVCSLQAPGPIPSPPASKACRLPPPALIPPSWGGLTSPQPSGSQTISPVLISDLSASAPALLARLGLFLLVDTTFKDPLWRALFMPPRNLIPSPLLVAGFWTPFS